MENATAFLMLTNITWGPAHGTDHGLVIPNLGINSYREFSLTFVAQAVAPAESWGLSLGSSQGSCAQNRDLAHSALLFLLFSVLPIPLSTPLRIYSPQCFQ